MNVSLKTHTVVAFLFAAVLSLSAKAQTPAPNTTEWENEALKLQLFYPSDLVKADTEQVMRDGRLTFAGVACAPRFFSNFLTPAHRKLRRLNPPPMAVLRSQQHQPPRRPFFSPNSTSTA